MSKLRLVVDATKEDGEVTLVVGSVAETRALAESSGAWLVRQMKGTSSISEDAWVLESELTRMDTDTGEAVWRAEWRGQEP